MAKSWKALRRKRKGKKMNPSLLQRPTKVEANTKVLYIYAPSVLTEGCKLEPGTVIKVLEVHKGKTKDETMLKVVTNEAWLDHDYRAHRGANFKIEDCDCQKPINEMKHEKEDNLKGNVFFVLLSDIGK